MYSRTNSFAIIGTPVSRDVTLSDHMAEKAKQPKELTLKDYNRRN